MPGKNTTKHLAEIVNRFSRKRIVVVGDIIADQFIYGEISRVSREAPVFILRHEHTETTPGGAGNCAANLAALGADVALISVVGDDEPGRSLLEKLRAANVDCDQVSVSSERRTTTKVRVLAGQIHSTRQQVIRIDYEHDNELSSGLRHELRVALQKQIADANAVIISDYNYGAAEPGICEVLKDGKRGGDVPMIVDSRFRLSSFGGFTSATPNEDEVAQLLHWEPSDTGALESAAEQLRRQLGYQALLVTRGSHGLMLVQPNTRPFHIDAVGSHQPVDVTGAGDTVIAAYTLALASGGSFIDAARLANFAGGIVVMKRGTATVSAEEILSSVAQVADE
jgi:rfaE bifunctional protein kinase chain/domain